MFEYKDNVLMGQAADICEAANNCFSCSVKPEASGDFDELARLVGEGRTLESHDNAEEESPPSWTEVTEADAPRLEFDLEDELSRAFEGRDVAEHAAADSDQSLGADFGVRALQDALTASDPVVPDEPVSIDDPTIASVAPEITAATEPVPAILDSGPVNPPEPETISVDSSAEPAEGAFAGMVSDEIEKALEEFDDEVEPELVSDTVDVVQAEAAELLVANQDVSSGISEESLEDFSEELARLMGEPDATEVVGEIATPPLQPSPIEPVMPWESPEIIQQDASPIEEGFQQQDSIVQPDVLQPSYPQESTHLPTATPLEVPQVSEGASRVDDVLARADALEAAATQSAPADEDLDYDLEAALSRELDAEFETSAEQDNESGPVIIPPIYMPGAGGGEQRQTGRRVAAGIVAIALLGGSAALAWSYVSSDTTEPPTILASQDPVKVKPKETGGKVVPNQDQSVYTAVDGKDDGKPKQDALKDTSEKPLAVAKAPALTQKTAETAGTVSTEGGLRTGTTDPQTTGGPVVAPRRVRTVVVRPDGTILQQASTAKSESDGQGEIALATSSEAPKPVTVKTTAEEPSSTEPKTQIAAVPQETPVQPDETVKPAVELKPVQAKPATKPAAEPKPAVVAKKPAPKPVEVTKVEPAKPAAADPLAPTTTSSPYRVQVSSRRSPEAAQEAYNSLARRFASIIGGKGVEYQKSKVKGKDYYRVRIPTESKEAAQAMCGKLKANGADCFVTR